MRDARLVRQILAGQQWSGSHTIGRTQPGSWELEPAEVPRDRPVDTQGIISVSARLSLAEQA
jgi:hypothetical protein